MAKKTRFGELLAYLLATGEIKNYTLATEVQYDVSYISKWLSGKVLPGEKNEDQILSGIAHCIANNSSENGKEMLLSNYQVKNEQELEMSILDHLRAECDYSRDAKKDISSSSSAMVRFFSTMPLSDFIRKMRHPVLRRVNNLDITAVFDVFSMAAQYRYELISNSRSKFAAGQYYSDVHYRMVIRLDVNSSRKKAQEQCIFIVNALFQMGIIDCQIYCSGDAADKAMFTVKDDFAIFGTMYGDDKCIAVVITEKKEEVDVMYHYSIELCTPENKMFQLVTMNSMLLGNDYYRSLLSANKRWVLGHMCEYFLPDSLFEKICSDLSKKQTHEVPLSTLRSLHQTAVNMLKNDKINIILFERAISDLAIDGILDFYNCKVVLSPQERIDYIRNVMALLDGGNPNLEVRLVYGHLPQDFWKISGQNVLLSDTYSLLRMTSEREYNLIHVFNRLDVQYLFERFFDNLWGNEPDIIMTDRKEILAYMSHALDSIKLMPGQPDPSKAA